MGESSNLDSKARLRQLTDMQKEVLISAIRPGWTGMQSERRCSQKPHRKFALSVMRDNNVDIAGDLRSGRPVRSSAMAGARGNSGWGWTEEEEERLELQLARPTTQPLSGSRGPGPVAAGSLRVIPRLDAGDHEYEGARRLPSQQ